MAIIAEFTLPTESFALAEALPKFPDVTVEIEPVVATAPDTTMPCVWASDTNESFDEALANDPTVESIAASVAFDGDRLYHVVWVDEVVDLIGRMVDREGMIVEASAQGERWRFRLRFLTREQFDSFRTFVDEDHSELYLERLSDVEHPHHPVKFGLSTQQREAITLALQRGYFATPKEVTLDELAGELDISSQALSNRIRRANETILQIALLPSTADSTGNGISA